MDQGGQGRRGSGACGSEVDRFASPLVHGRTAAHPRIIRTRGGELRFPRRFVDLSTRGKGHRTRVGCEVPPLPRQPHSERAGLDTPEAYSASQTAQGSRDPAMEDRAMARVEKKAVQEGRTIVFIDKSGFYLLPMVVRTWSRAATTWLRLPVCCGEAGLSYHPS